MQIKGVYQRNLWFYGNPGFHAYNIQFSLIKLLGETDVPGLNEGGQFIW